MGILLGFSSASLWTGATFQKVILWGFLISLTIETIQLITKTGTFEVDDLIYNTLGCAMGFMVCVGCMSIFFAVGSKTKYVKKN